MLYQPTPGDGEILELALLEGLTDALGETDADAELEGETDAEGDTDALALEDGLTDAEGLTEAEGETDGDALDEGETEGETEEEPNRIGAKEAPTMPQNWKIKPPPVIPIVTPPAGVFAALLSSVRRTNGSPPPLNEMVPRLVWFAVHVVLTNACA